LKKLILASCTLFLLVFITIIATAQEPLGILSNKQSNREKLPRCLTMEFLQRAIQRDPTLPAKWKAEGERQYQLYLQRQTQISLRTEKTEAAPIIIPIVFHLVDDAAALAVIPDRDVIEQVETLNRGYAGQKMDKYLKVIPPEIAARVGRIPIKFVLARRDPHGALTSGIERRANATPDHINIKSFATGGLDAWDSSKYLNVWCGTFTGSEAGLLGISTFPFTTDEGPQGVVINIGTLPFASNIPRNYFPIYSEGATLVHEVGHYFYLWHTFGDQTTCNNNDFQIQPGWPLPAGAGPEGDDTPLEKGTGSDNFVYGNPSMNYKDGCAPESFGMMYGSFMNYYDDRALFMFSDGMRKRVEGCINLYRPGLLTTDGATPPTPVNDAFLVDLSPRGTRERKSFLGNNTPLQAVIRNNGTTTLTSVTINVAIDAGAAVPAIFSLNLSPGSDTTLDIGAVSGAAGDHTLSVYSSIPNGSPDNFLDNDTLYSFINIISATASLPFTEDFSSSVFPSPGWQIWNPNTPANMWARNAVAGYTSPGAAFFDNYNINQVGTLDELITPALDPGNLSNIKLDFKVAYAAVDATDVSLWDGLEVYVSGDGGKTYGLAYKKTGMQLATAPITTLAFVPTPSEPTKWRDETIDLTSYVIAGKKMIIKFRNTNAFGNNIFIDDINVSSICASCTRDIEVVSIDKPRGAECETDITPSAIVKNLGIETITAFSVAYRIDSGTVQTTDVTGIHLAKNDTIHVSLPPATGLSTGQHTIQVYTLNPVSSTGSGDQVTLNDTLNKGFGIAGIIAAPLNEGFESSNFPPVGWVNVNVDADTTWVRTGTGSNSTASAFVNNFKYFLTGRIDELYSPQVNYSGVDSVTLSFDVAAAAPTNGSPTDTLEVLITKDCGNTFTSIYKKWGSDLQTVPNELAVPFTPLDPSQWRTETIDLTNIAPTGPIQIVFRNTNNNKNNIYIDNVNLKTKILPGRLKREGMIIFPNPFHSQFTVWHYQIPSKLKFISVFNSLGQLVWNKQFNSNALKQEVVDLSTRSSGVYIVKLGYTDSNYDTSVKVVKY
jgi:hypothetical protein